MTSTSSGKQAHQGAPARHARAADEVGVREWAELLAERGQQLLARAKRQRHKHASEEDGDAPHGGDSRRQRRR